MSEPSTEQPSGRRTSSGQSRRVDVLVALALVLVAIVALGLAVIGDETDELAGPRGPRIDPLSATTVVCPGGFGARSTVRVARTPGAEGGEVSVRQAAPDAASLGEEAPLEVGASSSVAVPGSAGPTVLEASGAAAPGLVAGRGDAAAVPECRAPAFDEWFVDVGASARYATVLELVNPDAGVAVVDLALQGRTGPIEEPALRGIQVPARGVKRIDLAKQAPRAQVFAAHLTVVRGRVAVTARNSVDSLGTAQATSDFLPAQSEPTTDNLILGLPPKPSGAALLLANPGEDEVRATIRFVTKDAVFTPSGLAEVAVPPGSLGVVSLHELLAEKASDGVVGLSIESTGELAASARVIHKTDLLLLGSGIPVREPTTTVVPPGAKTLVLGGAQRAGVVHVRSYDAGGKELGDVNVEIRPDQAASVTLPGRAERIEVEPRNTRIAGVVRVTGTGSQRGSAAVRLRPGDLTARVPAVAPE